MTPTNTALDPYSEQYDVLEAEERQPTWRVWFFDENRYGEHWDGVPLPPRVTELKTAAAEGMPGRKDRNDLPFQSLRNPQLKMFPWSHGIRRIRAHCTSNEYRLGECTIEVDLTLEEASQALSWWLLRPGNWVRVDMGYAYTMFGPRVGPVFFGRVDRIEPSWKEGMCQLIIVLFDQVIDLVNSKVTMEIPGGVSAGWVVEHIAAKLLIPAVSIGAGVPSLPNMSGTRVESGQAWIILGRIADTVGWSVWMQDGILHFDKEEYDGPATLHLEFSGGQKNVFSAEVSHDVTGASRNSQTGNVDDQEGVMIDAQTREPRSVLLPPNSNPDALKQLLSDYADAALAKPLNAELITRLQDPQLGETWNELPHDVREEEAFRYKKGRLRNAIVEHFYRNNPYATQADIEESLEENYKTFYMIHPAYSEEEMSERSRAMWRRGELEKYRAGTIQVDPTTGMQYIIPANQPLWPPRVEPVHTELENLPDTKEEAEQIVEVNTTKRGRKQVMNVTAEGNWVARPHKKYQIRGLQSAYDGHWLIAEVTHDISRQGYKIILEGRRMIDGRGKDLGMDAWRQMQATQREKLLQEEREKDRALTLQVVNGHLESLSEIIDRESVFSWKGVSNWLFDQPKAVLDYYNRWVQTFGRYPTDLELQEAIQGDPTQQAQLRRAQQAFFQEHGRNPEPGELEAITPGYAELVERAKESRQYRETYGPVSSRLLDMEGIDSDSFEWKRTRDGVYLLFPKAGRIYQTRPGGEFRWRSGLREDRSRLARGFLRLGEHVFGERPGPSAPDDTWVGVMFVNVPLPEVLKSRTQEGHALIFHKDEIPSVLEYLNFILESTTGFEDNWTLMGAEEQS